MPNPRLAAVGFRLMLAVIGFFSLQPRGRNEMVSMPHFTSSAFEMHAAAFGICTFLGLAARRRPAAVAIGVMLYGTSLEAVQHLMPTRSFNVFDLLGNALGIALACGAFFAVRRRSAAIEQ